MLDGLFVGHGCAFLAGPLNLLFNVVGYWCAISLFNDTFWAFNRLDRRVVFITPKQLT